MCFSRRMTVAVHEVLHRESRVCRNDKDGQAAAAAADVDNRGVEGQQRLMMRVQQNEV